MCRGSGVKYLRLASKSVLPDNPEESRSIEARLSTQYWRIGWKEAATRREKKKTKAMFQATRVAAEWQKTRVEKTCERHTSF
jgi:hypothetical protein